MKSFVKAKNIFVVFMSILLCVGIFSCTENKNPSKYDSEPLEKKLTMPYSIEGVLTQNGEKYNVIIENSVSTANSAQPGEGDFKIKFMSGDVTEGLTVEFFDSGVFLFFDDLRFKTNSEIFTNLGALKTALETLSAPYEEKYITNTAPVEGIDIIEIGVDTESGNIRAYVNKLDGTIIRLTENLNGTEIVLDVKKFENAIKPLTKDADAQPGEVYDVVDDYIVT